jgi:urate oxidase
LKETSDRIFGTAIRAAWRYSADGVDFDASWHRCRQAMIETFAGHDSKSVQQTLYAMGAAALKAQPAISEIRLSLPNRHCLPVDLKPFGLENTNEIFVPVDEPHGLIEATIVVRQ